MKYPKVSLISPCYNGELYLARFLECILSQDYPNIELIQVNDGSTDKSVDIFNSYAPKLEAKSIEYKLISQENQGLAGAVNTGLKFVTGEYLSWPDSDDILLPNFVSSRVNVLEKHPEAGIVVCPCDVVDEIDINKVIKTTKVDIEWDERGEKYIFEDIALLRNLLVFPGTFMIRFCCMRSTNPNLDFPHPREIGQDFQMLLPVAYKYKACYCPEVTFRYVIRSNSHSHAYKTKDQLIEKYKIGKDLLSNLGKIIPFNNDKDRNKYNELIQQRFQKWMMDIAIAHKDKSLFESSYKLYVSSHGVPTKFYKLNYYFFLYPILKPIYNSLRNIKDTIWRG